MRQERNFGNISCANVAKNEFGKLQAEIRQLVTTTKYYPSVKAGNSMSVSLFSDDEFGDETPYTSEENRVAWLKLPSDLTVEQVNALLKNKPKACIYRVLSSKPILTAEDNSAIKQGLTTEEHIALRQLCTNKDGITLLDDNGNHFFRRLFFHADGMADMDIRTADAVYNFPSVNTSTGEVVDQLQEEVIF